MPTNLKYMPTFRVRQQESLVLQSFNFEDHIYPLIEIIKKHDRVRKDETQKSFSEIYLQLINSINAKKVFVDMPVYLKETGAMNKEVLDFSRTVINNYNTRTEYLLQLSELNEKIIPVISSYLLKTGELNTIEAQSDRLSNAFSSIAYRLFPQSFTIDLEIIKRIARPSDYLILDIDTISAYPQSPPIKPLIRALSEFDICNKILLRSAINTDIQNVSLDHGQVVFDADNSHIETYRSFSVGAFGDYSGIKKDDLTSGGTISPGFIYYDATENQYYGYKATIKSLNEFETTIVPDVLASEPTQRMLLTTPPFLTNENWGYITLQNIANGVESGKSQAKFKRIAMEHYLHCIRQKIRNRDF